VALLALQVSVMLALTPVAPSEGVGTVGADGS
jgi:hypothetical protein